MSDKKPPGFEEQFRDSLKNSQHSSDIRQSNGKLNNKPIMTLESFFKNTQHFGSMKQAIGNRLYGLGHSYNNSVPLSRDHRGLVFFTRPQFNLTDENLRLVIEKMDFLANGSRIHRYIRGLLDPRLNLERNELLDDKLAFIPVFSNNVETVSGWPDRVISSFTSKAGVRREEMSMVDGVADIYEVFDLDVTFINTIEDPIRHIFSLWVDYMGRVFEGQIAPYPDFIAENEIDYNTRIYRIILDKTKTYVKQIACTGASFPVVDAVGKYFDYNRETIYDSSTKTINARFRSMGAIYNLAIVAEDFNETQAMFHPDYRNMISGKKHDMVKIPSELLYLFNYRGYPHINKRTLELEWYIDRSSKDYERVIDTQMELLNSKSNTKIVTTSDEHVLSAINKGEMLWA